MSEYSYEIDKYIVGVDNNGEDGIGLTIATMKDNELHILGSCYGDNARFIDLLIKENQELKRNCNIGYENLNFYREENSQLKDNWNKLKEIVKSQSDFKLKVRNKELWFEVDELLSKMEELEKGVNNE